MSKVPLDFGEWSEAAKLHFTKNVKFRKFEILETLKKLEKLINSKKKLINSKKN